MNRSTDSNPWGATATEVEGTTLQPSRSITSVWANAKFTPALRNTSASWPMNASSPDVAKFSVTDPQISMSVLLVRSLPWLRFISNSAPVMSMGVE